MNWPLPLRRATALAFFMFVNWLMLAPGAAFENVHMLFSQQDKIAHLGIFGGLTELTLWSLPAQWTLRGRFLMLLTVMLVYGAGIELVQPLLPDSGRSAEWMDLVADAIGIAVGGGLFRALADTQAPPDNNDGN